MFNKREYLDSKLNQLLENPKFYKYYLQLIKVNKTTNLTRITDLDSVYYKHFYDSIILSNYLNLKDKTLLDVGAGAGFPSLPIKIIEDSLSVTIIDSLNKRIRFLQDLKAELELSNVQLIHGRAEEFDQRERFDIVTSRAVAKLQILAELTIPFVKIDGYFVAYKSIQYREELEEARNAIHTLGGKIENVEEYQISEDEIRVLIFIKKTRKTPTIYPRHYSKIKKTPL